MGKAESLSLHNKDKTTKAKPNSSEKVASNYNSNSVTYFYLLQLLGSQWNFITKHMTHILHLKGKRVLSSITGLGHLSNQKIYIYMNCTQSTVLRKCFQYIQ